MIWRVSIVHGKPDIDSSHYYCVISKHSNTFNGEEGSINLNEEIHAYIVDPWIIVKNENRSVCVPYKQAIHKNKYKPHKIIATGLGKRPEYIKNSKCNNMNKNDDIVKMMIGYMNFKYKSMKDNLKSLPKNLNKYILQRYETSYMLGEKGRKEFKLWNNDYDLYEDKLH